MHMYKYTQVCIYINCCKNPNTCRIRQTSWPFTSVGFELRPIMKQIQVVVREGLKPGTARLRVRHAAHLAMMPARVFGQNHSELSIHKPVYLTRLNKTSVTSIKLQLLNKNLTFSKAPSKTLMSCSFWSTCNLQNKIWSLYIQSFKNFYTCQLSFVIWYK